MQQTRTHEAVTQRVEAKKLLSRQRQSEYSYIQNTDMFYFVMHVSTLWYFLRREKWLKTRTSMHLDKYFKS